MPHFLLGLDRRYTRAYKWHKTCRWDFRNLAVPSGMGFDLALEGSANTTGVKEVQGEYTESVIGR